MLNRQQAIIWTNADPNHWRIYAALGWDELNYLQLHLLNHLFWVTRKKTPKLCIVMEILCWHVKSSHRVPVMEKSFSCNDVIMPNRLESFWCKACCHWFYRFDIFLHFCLLSSEIIIFLVPQTGIFWANWVKTMATDILAPGVTQPLVAVISTVPSLLRNFIY